MTLPAEKAVKAKQKFSLGHWGEGGNRINLRILEITSLLLNGFAEDHPIYWFLQCSGLFSRIP
jgi:hypothetical protein